MKSFLKSVFRIVKVGAVVALFALVSSANHAEAGRLNGNQFADIFSSVFSPITSFFSNVGSGVGSFLKITPPVRQPLPSRKTATSTPVGANLVSTNCYAPILPKPANSDSDGRYGPMTITPVISNAGPNNIIKVIVTPQFMPTSVRIMAGDTGNDGKTKDIVDWSPKNVSGGKFVSELGERGWYAGKTSLLPEKIPYWIAFRAVNPTVPPRVPIEEKPSDFWRTAGYSIGHSEQGSSVGYHAFLVNGPQLPRAIFSVPKFVQLEPNESFEVSVTSKWQAGAITLESSAGAKVLGEKTAQAGANEVKTWRVQPLYRDENTVSLKATLKNTCGEHVVFADGIKIKYDFGKLTQDKVNLRFEPRSPITLGNPDSATIVDLSLFTKPDTKIGVPDITFNVRAVYADKPDEIVKSVMLAPTGGDKTERAGQITIQTPSEATGIAGTAFLRLAAPKLTAEEANRKIILIAETQNIQGLSAKTSLVVNQATLKNISVDPPARTLKEGEKVLFRALLRMTDGSTNNADASRVTWTLVGKIGNISQSGLFEAQLDESIAEYGEGSGAVIASYKDATGKTFVGKSEIFKVEAAVPEGGEEDG